MADGDAKHAATADHKVGAVDAIAETRVLGQLQPEAPSGSGVRAGALLPSADLSDRIADFKKLGFPANGAVLAEAEVPTGYGAVARAVGTGALNELTEHTFKVGGIAVGTGVATELATAFLKRPVLYAAGAVGAAWGAYKLCESVPSWIQSADVVAHGTQHSTAERLASQKVLSDFGAGSVDLAAGGLGAGLSRPVVGLGRTGLARLTNLARLTGSSMESTEGALAARATEPFLRDGLFEVPKTMSIGGDSEGAIYDLPGNKILKVKTQGITSAEEEANALVALGEKGIRVPRVFEIGKTTDGHDALIMQKVDADSYRDLILSGDRGRLTNALHDFTRQIGIMTKTGVAADDIQFGNILIGPKGEVSFIDPLRIVSTPHEFKVNRIIENMILNGARP